VYIYVFVLQDEVTVNVVRLIGVRIHAPLTRLQSGTTVSEVYHQYWLFEYNLRVSTKEDNHGRKYFNADS